MHIWSYKSHAKESNVATDDTNWRRQVANYGLIQKILHFFYASARGNAHGFFGIRMKLIEILQHLLPFPESGWKNAWGTKPRVLICLEIICTYSCSDLNEGEA